MAESLSEILPANSQSKLDRMIAELCPNGVEYIKLSNIVDLCRGTRVVRKDLHESGIYPVYQNSLSPLGYHSSYNCNEGTTFMIAAGAAGEIGYSDKNFWAADDCYYFICSEKIRSKFLYYFLKYKQKFILSHVRRASVPRISRIVIENIEIPILHIAIQDEIVRILDTFTELEEELEKELNKELESRKKQYEYYRDKLLTFNNLDTYIYK